MGVFLWFAAYFQNTYFLEHLWTAALVNQNRARVDLFATIVDNAFERYISELETNMNLFGQQENDETYDELYQ